MLFLKENAGEVCLRGHGIAKPCCSPAIRCFPRRSYLSFNPEGGVSSVSWEGWCRLTLWLAGRFRSSVINSIHPFLTHAVEPLSCCRHIVGLTENPGLDNKVLVFPDIFLWAQDREGRLGKPCAS